MKAVSSEQAAQGVLLADIGATNAHSAILAWRAEADEDKDGHYCFAVAL